MWVNVGSCICIDAACNQAKFKHDPRASVQQHPVMTSKNPTLTFNPATLQCTSASAASTHAEQAGKGLAASPRLFRSTVNAPTSHGKSASPSIGKERPGLRRSLDSAAGPMPAFRPELLGGDGPNSTGARQPSRGSGERGVVGA
jgi:hypothetical protein